MKKTIIFAVFTMAIAAAGCKPKKKVYTAKSVRTELRTDFEKIRELRNEGKLGEAAKLSISLGKRIAGEYPTVMMYREHVLKFMAYSMRIARLCRDKELELKNESTRPEEADEYKKFGTDINAFLTAIRAKLNTIPWMVPPKPKAAPKPVAPKPEVKKEATDKEAAPIEPGKKEKTKKK